MTARKLLFWVHLSAGSIAGIVILIMSASFLVLACKSPGLPQMRPVISETAMTSRNAILGVGLGLCGLLLLGLFFTSAYSHSARFDPGSTAAIANIGMLVFREGLECVFVLAASAYLRYRNDRVIANDVWRVRARRSCVPATLE